MSSNEPFGSPAEVHLSYLDVGSTPSRTRSVRPWSVKLIRNKLTMAITKQKKVDILNKLEGIKKESYSIVFVNFTGVTGAVGTGMRATLRNEKVGYFVAKKSLIKRAFADSFSGTMPELDGEIAVAYSEDAIATAQQIKEFTTKYKDNFAIVGGVFQGVYKTKEEMTEIASIPSLQVLRGMFVNVINSPIQGLAVALSQIAEKKNA